MTISLSIVSLIMCTGGAYRPFLHDLRFSAASSFQIRVFRGRRISPGGMLPRARNDILNFSALG